MEKKISTIPGIIIVIIQIALILIAVYNVYSNWNSVDETGKDVIEKVSFWVYPGLSLIVFFTLFGGYMVMQPNEAAVISFLGTYKGSIKKNGFLYINPFYGSFRISLKTSNYSMEPLKVNEKEGVPIEIAATIVWRVSDIYKAHYDVEDLDTYIDNQFEISLRTLAKNHTYTELSGEDRDFIQDLTEKVSKAGIEILDAKITHLNYVPEIAAAMLQKQQASSLAEAKEIIVNTAVHIATNAAKEVQGMTSEQKGKFIADLIVVLCSERGVSPVLNV